MAFDELKNMAKGWILNWNKGKLQKKLKETAQIAIDERVKNLELEEKNRQLSDEIRRLKNEKAKPKIKGVSSRDLEPPKRKKHSKDSKKSKIEIDQEIECDVDEDLPSDAKFLGYRDVVIQDLIFKRNNIRFKIKRYFSKTLGVIEGELPEEYKRHEFGPELRSFILYQYYQNRVPHRKIKNMLYDLGVMISAGTINKILNDLHIDFEEDLESAKRAGLKRCSRAHLDETSARLSGVPYYTFGLSNEFFAFFKTCRRKNKESVRSVLEHRGPPLRFIVTDDAPNLKGHIKNHQLCWVHEIRKYKLCEVYKRIESETLEKLLKKWRKFYNLMKRFRRNPSKELRERVRQEFDRVTSQRTLVKPLDDQLQRTKKLKENLLLFLKYPQLPLENNMIERDLRERVIKRKISLQNRSLQGLKAWDLMLSLTVTCQKLGLSFYDYLKDRISRKYEIPYLGKVVMSR